MLLGLLLQKAGVACRSTWQRRCLGRRPCSLQQPVNVVANAARHCLPPLQHRAVLLLHLQFGSNGTWQLVEFALRRML